MRTNAAQVHFPTKGVGLILRSAARLLVAEKVLASEDASGCPSTSTTFRRNHASSKSTPSMEVKTSIRRVRHADLKNDIGGLQVLNG